MDDFIKQPLSSTFRSLSVTGIRFDVGDHSSIEHTLAMVRGINAGVKIQGGSWECQPRRFDDPLQGL